jgi:hypothetical protein
LVCKQEADYKDPEFLRVLLRDNEELRVRCEPDRLTLRVDGMRAEQGAGSGEQGGKSEERGAKSEEQGAAETDSVAFEPNEFEETLTEPAIA